MDVEGIAVSAADKPGKPEPLFVRISEAARLLSMSRSAAYEAMRAGAIPAVRIAGKWRVPLAALRHLAERAETASAGEGEARNEQ